MKGLFWLLACPAKHASSSRASPSREGNAGFDIEEIPWEYSKFKVERDFLFKVVEGTKSKLGWDTLDYTPNEERIVFYLDNFKELILRFTTEWWAHFYFNYVKV
ncbi:hypothetical protein FPZ49_23750 [Paenibacillus cremeus]|uniref:Uncharacterized protein n=1 Tax=Paenibacillus cremeus TaxID=2163881 RepID=A0A559K5T4_9BACL|nr:hypothetical protein FPZ49_23750 [Paenibacillus cremeus]